jgi:hypothetical protein
LALEAVFYARHAPDEIRIVQLRLGTLPCRAGMSTLFQDAKTDRGLRTTANVVNRRTRTGRRAVNIGDP